MIRAFPSHTSAGARNWVDVETHDSIDEAVCQLKEQDMQVLVTNLSPTAVDFRDIDKDELVIDDTEMKKAMSSKKAVIFAQSFEKGSFEVICHDKEDNECDFVTDEPFDVKKIKNVSVTKWNDLLLLNSFEYEDYVFMVIGGESIGKGMSAWIHTNYLTKQFLNEEKVTEPHYQCA